MFYFDPCELTAMCENLAMVKTAFDYVEDKKEMEILLSYDIHPDNYWTILDEAFDLCCNKYRSYYVEEYDCMVYMLRKDIITEYFRLADRYGEIHHLDRKTNSYVETGKQMIRDAFFPFSVGLNWNTSTKYGAKCRIFLWYDASFYYDDLCDVFSAIVSLFQDFETEAIKMAKIVEQEERELRETEARAA